MFQNTFCADINLQKIKISDWNSVCFVKKKQWFNCWISMRKEKVLKSIACMGKIAASVLLKLFINVNWIELLKTNQSSIITLSYCFLQIIRSAELHRPVSYTSIKQEKQEKIKKAGAMGTVPRWGLRCRGYIIFFFKEIKLL